ncbi:protease [Chromobacterium violaceum]|uniref:ubiquinone anaerobic biosynthesis protein UbiU n=1 Tax=Chromobacterium violaceum TaxID=536 RepID=UPI000652BCE6|nr:peptidase U32 family protein [Chromobacterium violaceum]KMN48064.1 protease [Chromobacterium violaceum]KMN86455.1 protease [Chromobacterium violaceum]KMN89938.1 protease [Chromobacterium violaceum]KMO02148.1 protease [Chromobacterium violaceum]
MPASQKLPELVCPAGSLPALKAAVDHGADTVYFGLKNDTNARNFAGLNFDEHTARIGIRYAHERGRQVLMAINTYAQGGDISRWRRAVDQAADLGVDAVILADLGLLDYASRRHPGLRLHLSVQGSATNHEALKLAHDLFGIQRAVLPRVLTLDQVRKVIEHSPVEIEVFGFGSLCVMVEGRCLLSSYATGESPNSHGVCSPAKYVQWQNTPSSLDARLSGILIDQYSLDQPAGYPTLCKGRFEVQGDTYYALEEPTSLNVLAVLPQLLEMGVAAIKIEGRQRSPAYVAQVTRALREALDAAGCERHRFMVQPAWQQALSKVAEGHQQTLGAYDRPWK